MKTSLLTKPDNDAGYHSAIENAATHAANIKRGNL